MAIPPRLIFCAGAGRDFALAAVECGWLYGARLPDVTHGLEVHFADQDWKRPDRTAYMNSLAKHRPAMATVLDWEIEEQLGEVLSWAEEAAQHVTESVLLIPKVVGGVEKLPRQIGGKRVVLAYSVPTSYGGSPLPLWEHWGWPVHLLGGSPQEQMRVWSELQGRCGVVSVDGNMSGQQARKGRTWRRQRGRKGFWVQASDLGMDDERPALWCFRQSLLEIQRTWHDLTTKAEARELATVATQTENANA